LISLPSFLGDQLDDDVGGMFAAREVLVFEMQFEAFAEFDPGRAEVEDLRLVLLEDRDLRRSGASECDNMRCEAVEGRSAFVRRDSDQDEAMSTTSRAT
jgi:hypothetical protein